MHSGFISRRQFLRGDLRGAKNAIRPPWSSSSFAASCDRCGACVSSCPEKILRVGDGGFPVVDFSRGECTFCGKCVTACDRGALTGDEEAWTLKATVSESCLAVRGVVCRSCGESCEPGAIRFRLASGCVARPEIEVNACTGCGACYKPCPVDAVVLSYHAAGEAMDHPIVMGANV